MTWTERDRMDYAERQYRRRPAQADTEDDCFMGETVLSGRPVLKIIRFLSDDELAAAAAFDPSVLTLSGKPVCERARLELQNRGLSLTPNH